MNDIVTSATSVNGVRKEYTQEVFGPDLLGPRITVQRYVPEPYGDGYVVRDTHNGQILRTVRGSDSTDVLNYGELYVAPLSGAQFTADTLNKRGDWAKSGQ